MKNRVLNSKTNIINIVVLIVYVLLQSYFAMHHEAWRDESQAWIIAKNASFSEIWGLLPSEGHPCLWFYLLKICSMSGLSFYHLSLISIVIMTVAAALLLWKSPFSFLLKVCVLLSPIFFYYNPVICRIYSVVVLLIVLLCICWTDRRSKPIIYGVLVALLFQSHILVAGLAIGCLIERIMHYKELLRSKRNIAGFMIPVISFVCLILELRQTSETETYINITPDYISSRLNIGFVIQNIRNLSKFFDSGYSTIGVMIFMACLLMFIVYAIKIIANQSFRKKATDLFIVSLCGMSYYWAITICVREVAHVQMAVVFWMIMLFFAWTAVSTSKSMLPETQQAGKAINDGDSQSMEFRSFSCYLKNNVIEVLFLICCVLVMPNSTYKDPIADVHGQFSGSLEMAKMVEKNVPDGSVVVVHNDYFCTTIAAYLYEAKKDYTIWDIDNGCEFRIHKWGRPNKRTIPDKLLYKTIKDDCNRYKNKFYIYGTSNPATNMLSLRHMKEIGKNSSLNKWAEYYQLYKVD